MYFKRIELNGFKSFADPVTIEFTDGMTCIVGPNGSGKSNISDAIRWVLGEQSPKMLRGGKMEEVIFAGTQNRKPKGMAEVTLVIDNSAHILPIDFGEVAITRRMYRSGESEYMINHTLCRLKDIRELIMDTGIGVEGYSIIGQGRIADIIDNKMDSRREIFEEAAGVTKYRARKTEAERKLDNTINNLERVNDIIREIESRIGPLEEESKKAAEYLEIRDKYKDVEINIILKSIEQSEEKAASAREEYAQLVQKTGESEREKTELEKAAKDARIKANDLEERLGEIRDELLKATENIHDIAGREELNKQRKESLRSEKERLEGELVSVKEKIERERANLSELENNRVSMQEEHSKLKALLNEKKTVSGELGKKLASAGALNAELMNITVKAEELKVREGRVHARLKMITELESSYEGYGGGAKFLARQNLKGVIGFLGELLQVPKGYEVAIETVLGAKLQDVVCEDENTAKAAIALLKENKAGRMTFLPVETLRGQTSEVPGQIAGMRGYIGLASELVGIKGGYINVVDYMLGRVILVDTLSDALSMSRNNDGPFRFVTLEGEVINAAGAITGGSFKNNTANILSRKAEKEALTVELDEIRRSLAAADEERENIKKSMEIAGRFKEELEKAQKEEVDAKLSEAAFAAKLESTVQLLDRIQENIEELNSEKKIRESAIDSVEFSMKQIESFAESSVGVLSDMEEHKKELEAEAEKVAEERRNAFENAERLEADRSQSDHRLYEDQQRKHEAEVRLARFDSQTETLREKLWDEFEMSYAEAADHAMEDFVMSRAIKESRDYKDRLRELGDVNVGSIEEYKVTKERYDFLTAQRDDITNAMAELNSVISDMDSTIRKRFKESFDSVVENFEHTFAELFNGGHAQLTMDDPDNPLESVIEIEAQPPGKKLQNMNLLSGGEKTLTAIALMCAVLRSKPTPFVILDEVEAALDDANIDAFAKYLRKNFEDTQFTLVTHQKATMEYADALYGVTMPEHGVTRVLSLRLGDSFEM